MDFLKNLKIQCPWKKKVMKVYDNNINLKLMKSINSDNPYESRKLYDLAVKNKIPLLYLKSLKKKSSLNRLKNEYEFEVKNYFNFLNAISKISKILNNKVNYVIFKSIKPYPSVPGDIDVLILGEDKDYINSVILLIKNGYKHYSSENDMNIKPLIERKMYKKAAKLLIKPTFGKKNSLAHVSPNGTDFIDPQLGIDIDLQKELALNYIIYLDKKKFNNKINKIRILNSEVCLPSPALDLAITIAHSIAEQMYLLGEFYTTIYHFQNMNKKEIDLFIEILKENRILNAAKTFLSITKSLHEIVYGDNEKLDYIIECVGHDNTEFERLKINGFKLPHRYSLSVFLNFLMEKFLEKCFRRSLYFQVFKTLSNPRLMRLVLREFIEMRHRTHYLKGRDL